MEILNNLTNKNNEDLCVILGFFDGLHQGHKVVIKKGTEWAEANNTKTALITFNNAPAVYLKNKKPKYILTEEEKYSKLEKLGIDYLFILNFDEKFSQINASEYLKNLVEKLSPKAIITGENHFFGFNRSGNSDYLNLMKNEYNYEYFAIPSIQFQNKTVSSSKIREYLENGDIQNANLLLGYRFYIKGIVQKGHQLGQKIGFRTANLKYPENIVKIPTGVYAVEVEIDNKKYIGIANYGSNPTVSDKGEKLLEVHIINFNENIYNKNIKVNFLDKIRDEKKFQSLTELKEQIAKDIKCLES